MRFASGRMISAGHGRNYVDFRELLWYNIFIMYVLSGSPTKRKRPKNDPKTTKRNDPKTTLILLLLKLKLRLILILKLFLGAQASCAERTYLIPELRWGCKLVPFNEPIAVTNLRHPSSVSIAGSEEPVLLPASPRGKPRGGSLSLLPFIGVLAASGVTGG